MIRRACWFLSLLLLSASVQAALPPLIVDGDGDGVSDEADDCLYTPPGIQVNALGCPRHAEDGDADGVADPQDDCPYTPPGAEVDSRGCALDSDLDGVANGIDRCGSTALAAVVDAQGCAAGQTRLAAAVPRPEAAPVTAAAAPPVGMTGKSATLPVAATALPVLPEPLAPLGLPVGVGPQPVVPTSAGMSLPLVAKADPEAAQTPVSGESLQKELLAEEQARTTSKAVSKTPPTQSPGAEYRVAPVTTSGVPAPVAPLPESLSESLVFAARSAELSPPVARKLEALAPALRALASRGADSYLSVAAFSDRREGGVASRYAIRRSELVRAWLLAHGVPKERIRTSIRVLDTGAPEDNRRVEIRSAP